jgi:hypothetical protein
MKMVLEIPDDEISAELTRRLDSPARAALEALAAAAYGQNILSLEQVRRLLGLETAWQAKSILSRHGSWPAMSLEDFHQDMAALAALQARA